MKTQKNVKLAVTLINLQLDFFNHAKFEVTSIEGTEDRIVITFKDQIYLLEEFINIAKACRLMYRIDFNRTSEKFEIHFF